MDLDTIWNMFLEKIKESLSPMLYETWFAETKLLDLKGNSAKVLVPMPVHKKHLKENYNDLVEEIFTEIIGSTFNFEYLIEEDLVNNVEIQSNNVLSAENDPTFESNLDPRYTFENFIVGESNKFAKATSIAVAEQPGFMYNPLFIYGSSGLGKTHLMHAIGNYIYNTTKNKLLFLTSENFVDDFLNIYTKNNDNTNFDTVEKFKRKYRDIDVLMIDDIQYLEIANKTQQEFFNTFNELHCNNKQIVISSDRSPDDLKKLEERLRTRFNWGLTIDILPPDFKLRMDIIDKKIEGHDMVKPLPQDVKEYIASNCTSDIRKLEGAITRIFAYSATMNGADITLDFAIDALKDFFVKSIISKNKIEQVLQLVASNYNVTVEEIKSKKRVSKIAVPRQIAMYICRTVLEESLPKIGSVFGGKDHTTVMYSVDKIKAEIKNDANLEKEINKIISQIK